MPAARNRARPGSLSYMAGDTWTPAEPSRSTTTAFPSLKRPPSPAGRSRPAGRSGPIAHFPARRRASAAPTPSRHAHSACGQTRAPCRSTQWTWANLELEFARLIVRGLDDRVWCRSSVCPRARCRRRRPTTVYRVRFSISFAYRLGQPLAQVAAEAIAFEHRHVDRLNVGRKQRRGADVIAGAAARKETPTREGEQTTARASPRGGCTGAAVRPAAASAVVKRSTISVPCRRAVIVADVGFSGTCRVRCPRVWSTRHVDRATSGIAFLARHSKTLGFTLAEAKLLDHPFQRSPGLAGSALGPDPSCRCTQGQSGAGIILDDLGEVLPRGAVVLRLVV